MIPQPLVMFPWRCTVKAKNPTPGVDAAGARTDLFLDEAPDVPCRVRQATQKDVQEGTVSPGTTWLVAFRTDPGVLLEGSTIRVTHRDGVALDRPFAVQVRTLTAQQSGPLVCFRADCAGRG